MSGGSNLTHFLAVRITNEDVWKNVKRFRRNVLENGPGYRDCIIPVEDLHLTLGICKLDTQLKVFQACNTLRNIKPELSKIISNNNQIAVKGIGNFSDKTVYAKCKCPQGFEEMLQYIDHCFKQKGLDIQMSNVHHMTLMKITRKFTRTTGKETVDPYMYEHLQAIMFGEQILDNIHLCEMGYNRQADGFYVSPQIIDL